MEDQTIINNNNKTIEIPVIFYDGEREIDLGKVQITLTMTFKILQSTLSNKIGISPNHITIYLDRHNNNHNRRRHPVTSKFEFSSLEVGSCFFWVVLKRGRRNRRRRKCGNNDVAINGNGNGNVPFVLLRRGVNDGNDWEYLDYVNRLRMIDQFEREKERFFMSLNLNSNVYNELSGYNSNYGGFNVNDINNNNYSDDYYMSRSSGDDFDYDYDHDQVEFGSCSSSIGGGSNGERVFCEVCCNSIGETVPFHWCKNDVVVSTGARTRSIVGPIAPPSKNCILG